MANLKNLVNKEITFENHNIKNLRVASVVRTSKNKTYTIQTSDGQMLDTTPRFWSSFNLATIRFSYVFLT